jgi:hypothetical protein
MAQRLDERPLSVDPLMQQFSVYPASPRHGLLPQPLEDVPGFAEPVGIRRPHLGLVLPGEVGHPASLVIAAGGPAMPPARPAVTA